MAMNPRQVASEVIRVFARGERGSAQRVWRMIAFCIVEASFGKKARRHGLRPDIDAALDVALRTTRRVLGQPDFVPGTA